MKNMIVVDAAYDDTSVKEALRIHQGTFNNSTIGIEEERSIDASQSDNSVVLEQNLNCLS